MLIGFNKNKIALCILATCSLSTPIIAQAQDEQEEINEIERISVTSSRRVQPIQDVPASVIAVDPESFVKSGLTKMSDVISYTPGFNFESTNGQRGSGSISARGVSQQGETAVTALYIDDVPITSNSGFGSAKSVFFDGLLGDVERVELIKGPQGTLFGATAIGGAVRYISRTPSLDETRGSVTADISSINGGGISQLYRGYLSSALVEGKLGVTVSGFSANDAGYVDQVDSTTGSVLVEDANDSDNYGFSADFFFQATDDLDFRVKGIKQKSEYGFGANVNLSNLAKEETYGEYQSDGAIGDYVTEQEIYSATANYEASFASINFTSSYVSSESSSANDATSRFGAILETLGGLNPGDITAAPLSVATVSEKTSHELRFTSNSDGKSEWIAGLFYADESTNNEQSLVGLPADILGLYASFPSEYKEIAAFGNYTYYFTPQFDMTAGIRFSKNELGLTFVQDGLLLGGQYSEEQLETAKDDVQTYLFSARYRPSDETSLYARIASGYRPASSNLSIFHPQTGELLSQTTVDQDSVWSYELGAKGDLVGGKFQYDTSVWYLDWADFQANVTFFDLDTLGNARGGITAYGFDGAFTYAPTRNLTIKSALAYSNSTLNEDEPSLFGVKGAHLPRVPEWTLSSIARYDFQVNSVYSWLSGGFRYIGSSPSAFTNGDASAPALNIESDAYALFDVNAGFELDNVSVNLYVNNLFDNSSYAAYSGSAVAGTDISNITALPVKPRTIGISATYSF
ncbi:TonB-dependent receptor [Pseudoalteromonas shioyasakiensis]|uniref:TonB-dependent receptor n=1 Tax=Pseudoalteromonas shioyasakiensis TaxID=1190813 RepID=UPI0021187F97|nr:TonB-dependent receptor [Pseudoalteromonas shioyasakiensis]MCQ8876976.1 TonB-dependent receptor [Pseudoalteromonas shioyasakiensis]